MAAASQPIFQSARARPALRRLQRGTLPIIAAAAAAAVPLFGSPFALQIANLGGLMAIAAMALTVLTGTAGLLSLGHAAFLGIGAFTAGLLATKLGVPFLATVVMAGLVGLAVGALIAFLTLRISGLYLAIGTFALHYVVVLGLNDLEVKLTYAVGFIMPAASVLGLPLDDARSWWGFVVACLAVEYAALAWLVRSHVGRAWIVSRTNPTLAGALGTSLLRARMSAFMLTSFITAAAGAMAGYYLGIVVAANYTLHLAIVYVTVVVLGGLGSLAGAVVAAYAVTLLPYMIEGAMSAVGLTVMSGFAGLESIVLGIILAAVLLRLPGRGWAAVRKKIDARRG